MLESIITSKARRKLLALLFMNPNKSFYMREISRKISEPTNAVSSELARLEKASIIVCQRKGRMHYYQANSRCPLYGELKSIIAKTAGIGDFIRQALGGSNSIRFAFIYGSYARGDEHLASDIDIMLIGKLRAEDVVGIFRKLESRFGREMNYSIYPPEEYLQNLDKGFIADVNKGKKIMLVGDEDEFERFVNGRPD